MKRNSTTLLALAGAIAPGLASAGLLIDDGGFHEFDTAIGESISLANGSTLSLRSGAVVTGDGSIVGAAIPGFARAAVEAGVGSNSSIRLGGNSVVTAGTALVGISRMFNGDLRIGGNSVVNGGALGNTALFGYAVLSPPASTLRTSLTDDAVINGHIQSDGYISISGNATINGNLHEANAGMELLMESGLITGYLHNVSLVDHIVQIRGGSILGGYVATASSVDFSMRDGNLEQGWRTNTDRLNVEIKGGQIDGGMTFGWFGDTTTLDSSVNIFGGSIDAALDGWLFNFTSAFDLSGQTSLDCSANATVFNLWGGQLGYASAGNGIRMDLCANLDVYGTNLSYSGGLLSGTLADGSLINLAVTEGSLWGGQVRLHDTSVPEPGTLALFGAAFGTMLAMRRRKVRVTA